MMYIFEAHYQNDSDEDVIKAIKIESQLYDTEEEVYLAGLKKALDLKQSDEALVAFLFIAC